MKKKTKAAKKSAVATKRSATARILETLKSGGTLTTRQIKAKYNISAAASPIYHLRKAGTPVKFDGKRYYL